MKKIIAVWVVALLTLGATSAFAHHAYGHDGGGGSARVSIVHNGHKITVSCNALGGHWQHADKKEQSSLKRAEEICRKLSS